MILRRARRRRFRGTTSIIDFAIQGSLAGRSVFAVAEKARKAAIDYGFHMSVTDYNDRTMEEIPK